MPAPLPRPRIPGRRLLHAPGPTAVPDAVLHAMLRQPTDLADPEVPRLVAAAEHGLAALLDAPPDAPVFLYAANGHGGWEAVIANLAGPRPHGAGTVLVPGGGPFSDGWAEQAEALGARVRRTAWVEGSPIAADAVEAVLREDRGHAISAVFAVHTDTAAGVTSDLAALRRAIDAARHPALFVVDVVASLAAAPFSMRELGVDVALGASQKGLMLPPGLAFVAANARALSSAAANPAPRYYWDWARRTEPGWKKFCGTPPLAHLAGLEAALELIAAEGLAAVHERHRRLARAVHAAVDRWSGAGALGFFAQDEAARSVSVTTVATAPGIDPEALRTVARERFQVAIAGGLAGLAGRAFRIGHLGDLNEAQLLGCLAGVEAALAVQRVPHAAGGVEAAIRVLTGEAG